MPGGLVQLVVYGSQDIFLTGDPQITFFKLVYRRHTNFAIETLPQHFIGTPNFGDDIISIVDKMGDLMGRIYLEIELPEVNLFKNPSYWSNSTTNAKRQFDNISSFYEIVNNYISTNTNTARQLYQLLITNNICMSDIVKIVADNKNLERVRLQLQEYIACNPKFDEIIELRDKKIDLVQQINQFDVQVVFHSVVDRTDQVDHIEEKRKKMLSIIKTPLYQSMKDFYMIVYNLYLSKEQIYQTFLNKTYVENHKFAWVEEIGHSIIDHIDISIGNQVMDKHTGDWLIMYNKLYLGNTHLDNYNKMIGNVDELTSFDENIKGSYKLLVPLQFWFCRHLGLSIPIIALRYHDIILSLKFKELSKLCWVDDSIEFIDIRNRINIPGARLYVDYIYLDSDERKRFAQSTHEYLIETVQYDNFDDIVGKQFNADMHFMHPTKYVVWVAQPEHYRENFMGHSKCQWNNFGTHGDKSGYTMGRTHLVLNNYDFTDPNLDIIYYNYVCPNVYFGTSPTDGFNVYSFALKPKEHQPTGTINLSRIDSFYIRMEFTEEFLKMSMGRIHVGVYVMSYNILRIMNGMGGLAFARVQ